MNTRNAGNDVVVVVSAQGDTTDDLITKAAEITSDPSHREMDMLLAAGEEISISLLTMALQELWRLRHQPDRLAGGLQHRPRLPKARIKRLDTERVESELARNRVVVVAGFQGLNRLTISRPWPRRQRYLCRGTGGCPACRPLPDLHRRRRCLHRRPAQDPLGHQAERDHV